jgi:hypothetical protein
VNSKVPERCVQGIGQGTIKQRSIGKQHARGVPVRNRISGERSVGSRRTTGLDQEQHTGFVRIRVLLGREVEVGGIRAGTFPGAIEPMRNFVSLWVKNAVTAFPIVVFRMELGSTPEMVGL